MGKPLRGGAEHESESCSSLKDALAGFLQTSGLDTLLKYPKAQSAWEGMVGQQIAEHTRVASFKRGVLEIAVDSSSLLSEMQFLRDALLHDVRSKIQKPFVAKLSFVLRVAEKNGEE